VLQLTGKAKVKVEEEQGLGLEVGGGRPILKGWRIEGRGQERRVRGLRREAKKWRTPGLSPLKLCL
jgi:hypothetical protein